MLCKMLVLKCWFCMRTCYERSLKKSFCVQWDLPSGRPILILILHHLSYEVTSVCPGLPPSYTPGPITLLEIEE